MCSKTAHRCCWNRFVPQSEQLCLWLLRRGEFGSALPPVHHLWGSGKLHTKYLFCGVTQEKWRTFQVLDILWLKIEKAWWSVRRGWGGVGVGERQRKGIQAGQQSNPSGSWRLGDSSSLVQGWTPFPLLLPLRFLLAGRASWQTGCGSWANCGSYSALDTTGVSSLGLARGLITERNAGTIQICSREENAV